ncbi:TolC family protein [Parachitinimonas caeni]|uniref:TolC family protein n=1 Tax=Parachitinimonas caeni TaxID=3031301 RepID=A0ABT7E3I7_9NEIS|nr:TolC family protein [Parachitinimonas caeni]MDK2126871.1 TolC family protein [Parachitinimonas caeni]
MHIRFAGWMAVALLCGAQAETLEQAWQAALADNPALQGEVQRRQAAEARQAAAQALDWPTLVAAGGAQHLSSAPQAELDLSPLGQRLAGTPQAGLARLLPSSVAVPLAERDLALAELKLSYPLYTGGRIGALQAAAGANSELARAGEHTARQTLKLAVAESYLNVLRAEAALDVATHYRNSLQRHRQDVVAMEAKGLAAPVERMTAEVALADAERRLIDARQAGEIGRAAYNRQLARPADAPVRLEPVVLTSYQLPADAAERALRQRPELAALQSGGEVLRQQAGATRAEDAPQVAVEAMHLRWRGLPTTDTHTSAIGLVMRWHLFDGGQKRQQAAALSLEAQALESRREDAKAAVLLEVRQSTLAENAARQRLAVSEAGDALAAESLRLMRSRYQQGVATQTEVLAAETRLADARRALLDARYDLQLARLRLQRAIGEL